MELSNLPKIILVTARMLFLSLKYVYLASTKQDTSFKESGHKGESATTFPMMIRVGDTNSADVIC
jgi:hypothetical protein